MRSPWLGPPHRRALWLGLIAFTALMHLVLGARVVADVIGWDAAAPPIHRIDVDLVSELAPTAPPVPAPHAPEAPPLPRPRAPRPAASAASAVGAPASAAALAEASASAASAAEALASARRPDPPAAVPDAALLAAEAAAGASAPTPRSGVAVAPGASAPGAAAGTAPLATAAASTPVAGPPMPALEWPPSTRLVYTVTGLYKGQPCYGTSVVEWRHEGNRYQIEFDLQIDFLATSHMVSEGTIGEAGLEPARFDQEIRWALFGMSLRRYAIRFLGDGVQLSNGSKVARLPALQDAASQFVQFVWMFTLHPELLQPGRSIEMPLVLPRRVGVWVYDAQPAETLALPFGNIDAVHMKPRAESRRPGEFTLEIWSAPTLQYLPVKLHARLDDDNSADIMLKTLPRQAALPGRRERPLTGDLR